MYRKTIFIVLIILLFSVGVYADQHEYISKRNAIRAKKIIELKGNTIGQFCQQCGDTTWRKIDVETMETQEAGYENYWILEVNNEAIDLAYTYVESDGKWSNLAMMLGLDVVNCPEFLDKIPLAAEGDPPDVVSLDKILEEGSKEYIYADGLLNNAYQELMKALPDHRKETLREAQRKWIPFRDKSAEFSASLHDSQQESEVTKLVTQINLTADRTAELNLELNPDEKEEVHCYSRKSLVSTKKCIEELYKKADDELNEVYFRIMAELNDDQSEKLKQSEIAWIEYRDACADYAASEYEYEEMKEIAHVDELRLQTEKRVKQLKGILMTVKKLNGEPIINDPEIDSGE
jgi:uncharacterized protein YecT (DUF1311 family)